MRQRPRSQPCHAPGGLHRPGGKGPHPRNASDWNPSPYLIMQFRPVSASAVRQDGIRRGQDLGRKQAGRCCVPDRQRWPTGMPAGKSWPIEKQGGPNPERGAALRRHPKSRQGGGAATIPGRWAAPPAPAMKLPSRPGRGGPVRNSHHRQRRAWAEKAPAPSTAISVTLQIWTPAPCGQVGIAGPSPPRLTGARFRCGRGVGMAQQAWLNVQGEGGQRRWAFLPLHGARAEGHALASNVASRRRPPARATNERSAGGCGVDEARVRSPACGRCSPAARLRPNDWQGNWLSPAGVDLQINGGPGPGPFPELRPRTCPPAGAA